MQQAIYHQYPNTLVKYKFKCRNKDIFPQKEQSFFLYLLEKEIDNLCKLKFDEKEIEYLSSIKFKFLKSDFIEFLKLFQFNKKYIKTLDINMDKGGLQLEIEGPWISTILFEVPLLSIISEINNSYFESPKKEESLKIGITNITKKINFIKSNSFTLVDFGTRRRFSFDLHEEIIRKLKNENLNCFYGTSNLYFSKKYKLRPIGSIAHEFFMCFQQLQPKLIDSQKIALESWIKEYIDPGIVLSDTIGIDQFLNDFDLHFAKIFDGVRIDSGNPEISCKKVINHYKKLKIDPKTKYIVFSDSLDFEKAYKLNSIFKNEINVTCGIGTFLTNDVGIEPSNIVIKVIECNGKPVAKISDSPGKEMCEDPEFVNKLKHVFNI
jgi:nicotinate phosphoribosyltransferase